MKWNSLQFSLVYVTPLIVLISIYAGSYWTYSALILLFGFIPFLELFTKGSTKNLSEVEESLAKNERIYDWIIYGLVPLQYIILMYFLFQVSNQQQPLYVKLGLTIAFGISCGILGINAAHELGHRSTWYEQLMSKMLLLTTLYLHFYIEHNRGHHKHVATDHDPASSKKGESVYAFYFRSIWGSWKSAWQLEIVKLKRKKLSFWSIQNEMLIFQILQVLLVVFIAIFFGIKTLLFFLIGAALGILLLETVNYIEHYGLRRKSNGDKFERTLPIHSWNSNHPIGRLFLLELTRHSDHHYMASRKYQILRHFNESPQMPTGYPGMMLLSLFPPLWFYVMNKRMEEYNQSIGLHTESENFVLSSTEDN